MSSAAVIPAITDERGSHWRQPQVSSILIDEKHAVMLKRTFEELAEYSATIPSGIYHGKMWRRHDGAFDPSCKPSDRTWLLCWYGFSEKGPEFVSTNFRAILLLDGELPG